MFLFIYKLMQDLAVDALKNEIPSISFTTKVIIAEADWIGVAAKCTHR